jgi:membrane-associated phospholipid phosphatase
VSATAVGVASILDRATAECAARHPFDSAGIYTMLRLAGYLPVWILVSAAFALIDGRAGWRAVWSRGGPPITAVILSGGAAEALKFLVRRERPTSPFAEYIFRPGHQDTFSTAGPGWPSSHVAVAFAAAWVLCRLHSRASVVWDQKEQAPSHRRSVVVHA